MGNFVFVSGTDSFSSDTINSGLYIFSPEIFRQIGQVWLGRALAYCDQTHCCLST
jgi:NDP-sugar pyrophosphorylase family protein